jgi:hypothetical protein
LIPALPILIFCISKFRCLLIKIYEYLSYHVQTFNIIRLGEPFRLAWLDLLGTPYTNDPVELSGQDLNDLPTIILQFRGDTESNKENLRNDPTSNTPHLAIHLDPAHPLDVLLAVPPSHYMEYQEENGMYVAGLYFDEPEGSVLGANIMMLHDVFFDVQHYRIGWAESLCDYAQMVGPFVKPQKSLTADTPLLRIESAQLDLQHMQMTSFQPVFCTSVVCRFVVIVSMILSAYICTKVVLSYRGKHKSRRQRRQRPPSQMQRHTSRMVSRSTSLVLSSSSSMSTPPASFGAMAMLMSKNNTSVRPPAISDDDNDFNASLVVDHSNYLPDKDFMIIKGVRRGALLRSRSNQVALQI